MPRPDKPKGIMLLAAVGFVMAVSFVLVGSLIAVTPSVLRPLGFKPVLGTAERVLGLGFFGGVGVVAGIVGYGLATLRRWAHAIASLSALSVLLRGVTTVLTSAFSDANLNPPLDAVAAVALSLAVLWYLWTPGVRAVFRVQAIE